MSSDSILLSDSVLSDDSFLLFDNLYDKFKSETEFNELNRLATTLKKIDSIGLNIISLLIKSYTKRVSSSNTSDTPYDGQKINDSDVNFDIRNFDHVLQHILLEFSDRHLNMVNGEFASYTK